MLIYGAVEIYYANRMIMTSIPLDNFLFSQLYAICLIWTVPCGKTLVNLRECSSNH